MKPSYDPGRGRVPERLTVTGRCSPAGISLLAGVTVRDALESASRFSTVNVNVAEAAPVLVMFRVRLIGSAAAAISPNEIVAGWRVAPAFTASPAFSLPAPTAVTRAAAPASVTSWVAVLTTA